MKASLENKRIFSSALRLEHESGGIPRYPAYI